MKILIIEDNADHMSEAVAAVEAAGHTVMRAMDMNQAEEYIPRRGDKAWDVDAVISDVYFPFNSEYDGREELDCGEGQNYSEPQPIGTMVALRCEAKGVPFVLCTDGYHHGNALQWVFALCQERQWKMVDAVPETEWYTKSSAHKNWQAAIEAIEKMTSAQSS